MNLITGFKPKKEPTGQENPEQGGSFVMKGFKVPQGYVLYIQTKTGGVKTVPTGGFSGGNAKFQDVLQGSVEGWTLQQVSGVPEATFQETAAPEPSSPQKVSPSVQAESQTSHIEDPKWGTNSWVGDCYLIQPSTMKRLKRTLNVISQFDDEKSLRQYLKANPEWTDAIQGYYKEILDEGNIQKYTTSAGVSPTFSRGSSTPKLKQVMEAIIEDAVAAEKNYELYSQLLTEANDKASPEELRKIGLHVNGLRGVSNNGDLYSKSFTPKLEQMLRLIRGEESIPREKKAPANTSPLSSAVSGNYNDSDFDDDDWDDDFDDDVQGVVEKKGGGEWMSALQEKAKSSGEADFFSDMYYYYVDTHDGYTYGGSSKYADEDDSMTASGQDFITLDMEDFGKYLDTLTPEEAAQEFAPVLHNYFIQNSKGEYFTKKQILTALKEQIDTMPDTEQHLLRTQLEAGGVDVLDEDNLNAVIQSIRDTGYGYDKEVSFEEFDKTVEKVQGRALELSDFPRLKISGMSYPQSRFEILKRLLSASSYEETFKDMNAAATMSVQPFSDFASEIIRDYIEYLGGSGRQADKLFSDYVIDNNKMSSSFSAVMMRRLESEAVGEDYSSLPDSLRGNAEIERQVTSALDDYRSTYQAVKTAHSEIFAEIYPQGAPVGRVFSVPSPSDEEIENFDITLSQVSSFSTATPEYLMQTFGAGLSVHRPGGTTNVYVHSHIKADKVVMLPNLFGWQSHWRKRADGSKYLVVRQNIPNKRSSEQEVIVSGRSCVTLGAQLKKFQDRNRSVTGIEAEVRIL